MWNFYLIKKNNYTYAGVTVNTSRRLRQHNGIIKGGAKYTTSKGMGWDFVCIVSGFPNRKYAQQFEWANKHPICHGIKKRIDRLYEVLNMELSEVDYRLLEGELNEYSTKETTLVLTSTLLQF